ncbi:MAG: serine/threonine protein kinase [Deltaproteobacteria bacterium]|nr:serine/threonine protein kinase [Deltaproteobacteria bacterium]
MNGPTQFGKYTLCERLAVGGMAEIFRAKMYGVDGFEKNLVVKQILPQYARNREFIQMFVDEAKITVSLSHGNIVPVYELGQYEGTYFIAMDWVDGRNLGEILDAGLDQDNHLSLPHALFIASELLAGLDYAHRKTDDQGRLLHIVHRDVSPQNVLISYEGEVKIVDFGIARAATKVHETRSGIIKGKFGYMAPEQASGGEVDARSDVFAVGILLYEMLTLERLFAGDNDAVVLDRVKRADVPTPSRVNPKISPQLDAIVFKALAADPANRYQSADEMRRELSRFLYSMSEEASPKTLSAYMKALFAEDIARHRVERAQELSAPAHGQVAASDSSPGLASSIPAGPEALFGEQPASGPVDMRAYAVEEDELEDDFSFARAGRRIKWIVFLSILGLLGAGIIIYFDEISHVFSTIGQVVDESAERLSQKKLGTLYVRSRPSGAAVYFGNTKQGTTNMRISNIDPTKEYELVLTMEGFPPWSRKVLPSDWTQGGEKMEIQVFKDWNADSFK